MQEFWNSLPTLLSTYGLKIMTAILIMLIGRWIARFTRKTIRVAMTRKNTDKTVVNFFCSVAYAAVLAFVAVAALGQLGV